MAINPNDQITIYKDNATGLYYYINASGNWQQFTTGSGGVSGNIYTEDGTLESDRTVDGDGTAGLFEINLKDHAIESNDNAKLQATNTAIVRSMSGNVEIYGAYSSGGYTKIDGVKEYEALLSQTTTNNPTVQVLKNTLGGNIVWTRDNTGDYVGTLEGAFTSEKTTVFFTLGQSPDVYSYMIAREDDDTINLVTFNDSAVNTDLNTSKPCSVLIRVHP